MDFHSNHSKLTEKLIMKNKQSLLTVVRQYMFFRCQYLRTRLPKIEQYNADIYIIPFKGIVQPKKIIILISFKTCLSNFFLIWCNTNGNILKDVYDVFSPKQHWILFTFII